MNVNVRIAEGQSVLLKSLLKIIHYIKIYRPIIFVFTPSPGGIKNVVISELLNVNNRCFPFRLKHHRMLVDKLKQYSTNLFYVIII